MIKKKITSQKDVKDGTWDSNNVGRCFYLVEVKMDKDNIDYKLITTANIDICAKNDINFSGSLTKIVRFFIQK